ncbi:hypothetical protein G7Z17_g1480 [Cylindrodendrum hubeiense]|uniref:CorA-like transporter domain-containing protein n=1 Tax=Cylindrodendrum hubeiense TaxID=595255 RepID=A0A9P5HEU6_9HYPO|nr:hypothetical protein G7Z17_g1480 [Cylindrodendrum hubeiense]
MSITVIKYDVRHDILESWLWREFGSQVTTDGSQVWSATPIAAGHSSWWSVTAPRELTKDETHELRLKSLPPKRVPFGAKKGTEMVNIDSEDAVKDHLENVRAISGRITDDDEKNISRPIARYYLLEPGYAWSELPISYKGALDLLSTFRVFPELYTYLSAFGRKGFPQDESFAGFDCTETIDEDGALETLESCYLLKYVGLREDASKGTNPWSIRHALIYQKVDFGTWETNHILVRIPETMESRLGESILKDANVASDFVREWTQLHSLSFGSVGDNLRQFINYLDEEVTGIFERMALAGVEPEILNQYDTPHSSATDMKTIHYLDDQAQRISSLINLNIETIGCLLRQARKLKSRGHSSDHGMITQFEDQMQKIKQDHKFSLLNVSAIIKRAHTVSEQLRDIISLRNSEINKKQTEMATGHTKAIFTLSRMSSQEAHVVKTLTGLALIFVPASFVAVNSPTLTWDKRL